MICFLKCSRINVGKIMHGTLLNHLICFDHFKQDNYVRDLKSELLGYAPRVKI